MMRNHIIWQFVDFWKDKNEYETLSIKGEDLKVEASHK